MSAPVNPARQESAGLLYTVVHRLVASLAYTSLYFIGFTFICIFPVLAVFVGVTELSGFGFLVLLGWSIFFSQVDPKESEESDGKDEMSKIAEILGTLVIFIYLNIFFILVVAIGDVLSQTQGPVTGITTSLLLPFVELELIRRGLWYFSPLAWGITAAVALGDKFDNLYRRVPIRQIVNVTVQVITEIRKAQWQIHTALLAHQLVLVEKWLRIAEDAFTRPLRLELNPYRKMLESRRPPVDFNPNSSN